VRRKVIKINAFTLIELLTVLFIIALLMSILVPALRKAKRSVTVLLSSQNKREIITGSLCYSTDQDSHLPESVATLGTGTRWSWREPTVLTGFQKRGPAFYRSVSEYLGDYIENASTMFCPSAPSRYEFAEEVWAAGDAWDNPSPDTGIEDPLFGNYCLYWNYIGYLEEGNKPFIGPRSTTQGKFESKLMISDYFGYGHWRNELTYGSRNAYGSCEKMSQAAITAGTLVACDFWSLFNPNGDVSPSSLDLSLRAGYIDGHVEKFKPADILTLKVSMTPDGRVPYPDNVGPAGTFYIPRNSW
jgi:prepilin-type N-terminal cleavage/methylation domain-containing protein